MKPWLGSRLKNCELKNTDQITIVSRLHSKVLPSFWRNNIKEEALLEE
jgi:hypothetical protein